MNKFTYSGDSNAEKNIAEAMAGIAADIASLPEVGKLRAVVLGGGYGRGEGGVTAEGKPYNDFDFFVIPKEEIDSGMFAAISQKWHGILGIDIDFSIVSGLHEIHKNGATLMMQELFAGYEVIFGDRDIFADAPVFPLEQLPWREGARLLLNRGTGLLLSRRKLQGKVDSEFIRRNIHKAALGCGDALLIASHDYRQSGMDRLVAVKNLVPGAVLTEFYERALEYKYRPDASDNGSFEELQKNWDEMRLIFFQTVVLFLKMVHGKGSSSPYHAARQLSRNHTESPGVVWKNAVLSMGYLYRMPEILLPLREHPRVKLLAMLVKILENPAEDPQRYLNLWKRFN